jgi:hypothetical protein
MNAVEAVAVSEADATNKTRKVKNGRKTRNAIYKYSNPDNSSKIENPNLPTTLTNVNIEKDLGHLSIIQSLLSGEGAFLRYVEGG